MQKLRPWLIAAWFLALFSWTVYSKWSAIPQIRRTGGEAKEVAK